MASEVEIANRALQKIGASRITSFDEGSKNADEVKACYEILRRAELRSNFWIFAIKRVALAASSTSPISGRTYAYPLPGDYLRMAPLDPGYSDARDDFLFEGRDLLTDQSGPLYIRYVSDVQDAAQFDSMFADALSMRIAMELAEPLTQSATKQETCETAYSFFIAQARKVNAIEAGPIAPEIDEMVAVRFSAMGDATLRKYSN